MLALKTISMIWGSSFAGKDDKGTLRIKDFTKENPEIIQNCVLALEKGINVNYYGYNFFR
jgi:hypothetical protein